MSYGFSLVKPVTIRSMKSASLGELEQQIMDIVWECKNCSARDVLTKIEKDKKLAYTTVATILQRLYKKGLVHREYKKRVLHYSPKLTKKDYGKNVASSFISKFFSSFPDVAVASFAESIEGLPKNKRKYLLKLLSKNEVK